MTNLINRIFIYPLSILKLNDSGSLIQRISDYEVAISEMLNKTLSVMFGIITLLILLGYIAYCNIPLGFLCLLCGIVFTITKLLIFSRHKIHISSQMIKQGKILSLLNEMFLQIHKIRIFNTESKVFYKWFNHLVSIKNDFMHMQQLEIIQEYSGIILASLAMLCLYLILYFSTTPFNPYFILQFIVCAGLFSNALEKTLNDIFSLLILLPGLNRMNIMELQIEESDIPYPYHSNKNAAIQFKNVSVANDNNNQGFILNNISFNILPGEFIGLIGKSGAGKSTIFKLLTGLISPTKGDILINNNSIRNFNIRHLRKQFGVVLQNSNLLPGTIYSNIGGHARISMDEAWEIAKQIGLDQEINNMPMKMHTYISDNNGESISGGQKQKILIARALAVKPGIILLDEATSALDNNSQNIIYQYLKSLNITRIVIAHRYNTLVDADMIYRIDNGCIVQSGRYKDLCCQTEILSL